MSFFVMVQLYTRGVSVVKLRKPLLTPYLLWNQPKMSTVKSRNLGLHNIELSSAADHAKQSRFLTGLHARFETAPKATAPTICYAFSFETK
jgi:hypothetical protein